MINVWTYLVGKRGLADGLFTSQGGEWNYSFPFTTFADMAQRFRKARIAPGAIRKLGIVAHGNAAGLVQLNEGDLTPENLRRFGSGLAAVRPYLEKSARVIFYSCLAASGEQGSALLNALSGEHFKGQHVIGFERYGAIAPYSNLPGMMLCSTNDMFLAPCDPAPKQPTDWGYKKETEQILNEHTIYAKWSYQGQIIKLPYSEVVKHIYSQKVLFGAKQVKRVVSDEHSRAEIEYIAIDTKRPSKEIQDLWIFVQGRPYFFVPGPPAGRLRELTPAELAKLPVVPGQIRPPRIDAAAVFKRELLRTEFKCAWEKCPTHAKVEHFCTDFVEAIPNGPCVRP